MSIAALDSSVLDKCLARFERRLPPIDVTRLAKTAERIRAQFGSFNAPAMAEDRIEAAVRQATRDFDHLRSGQRLLLAFALAQPLAALGGKCLYERESVLNVLLSAWERDARRGTLRLSHWKGLFHSYMQVPAGKAQQRLARLLRAGLEPAIQARRHPPAWLEGFRRHEHLLSRSPCAPYLADLMDGRSEQLQDLTEHAGVSIPPVSWFWQRLKADVLDQIARMGKASFIESIKTFIGMDGLIPLVTNDLVKALLERYEACSDHAKHPALMDFALNAWSSPQLDSNLSWNECSKAAREMVCRWIAKEDLEQFYRLCKGDHEVDEERLEFWLCFQKQMTYTQILLGRGMRHSSEPGIRKFVTERTRQGRLGDLVGGTNNNAMVMQIGRWVFVEFSQIGTACRCIEVMDRTFETGQSEYALSELRSTGEQWVHMPSGAWQSKFQERLAIKGIYPDDGRSATRPQVAKPAKKSTSSVRGDAPDVRKLISMGLRVSDHRSKGGALWVFTPARTSGSTLADLTAMGFRYAKSKGAWYHS